MRSDPGRQRTRCIYAEVRCPTFRLSLSICLVFAATVPGGAQSVSGTVSDQLGHTVSSVVVTLRDAAGVVQSEAVSDSDGGFQLPIPRSGDYRIVAHAVGHLPTESLLFAMDADGVYGVDIEIQAVRSSGARIETPSERYLEWVRARSLDWKTREIIVLSGHEWRELASGRDMVEALRLAGFPAVSLRRTPTGFCAHSGASTDCMDVVPIANGATPRLRDIGPREVDGVVFVGPGSRTGPRGGATGPWENRRNASILLFMRGYFAYSPR